MKFTSFKQRTVASLMVVGAGILALAATILSLQLNSRATFQLNSQQLGLLEASGETLDALTHLTLPIAGAADAAHAAGQQDLYVQMLKRYNDQKIRLRELALQESWAQRFMESIDDQDAKLQSAARQVFSRAAGGSLSKSRPETFSAKAAAGESASASSAPDNSFAQFEGLSTQLESTYRDFESAARRKIAAQAEEDSKTMSRAGVFSAIVVLTVLLMCGLTASSLIRSVYKPLAHVNDALMSIEGDLTRRLDVQGENEVSKLSKWFNEFVERLDQVVSQMKSTAADVASAAGQLSEENQSFSHRLSEQAAAVQEIAATMSEMATTVKQNATNSQAANSLASSNRQAAIQGGKALTDLIESVRAIDDSSNKISEIIGVIEDLGFQTNLLALNAAIEAARAGEQGKGFAVVAAEVRNLAARSSAAAHEISSLISENMLRTKRGMDLAGVSGQRLDTIIENAKSLADLVSEISAASQEQSEGIQQVNSAIGQMDRVTQQNAAMLEQSSALSEELASQAGQMNQQISVFNTSSDAAQPPVPRKSRTVYQPRKPATAVQPERRASTRQRDLEPLREEELIESARPEFRLDSPASLRDESFGGFEEF